MKEIVSRGDIARAHFDADAIALYLGSGRCGAQFDSWGLMNRSDTALRHADAWQRDAKGKDRWKAAFALRWQDEAPAPPQSYRQSLTLADGTLETRLSWPDHEIVVRASFHPQRRDWLALEIEHQGAMPPLELALLNAFEVGPDADRSAPLDLSKGATGAHWSARTLDCLLSLRVDSSQSAVRLENNEGGVSLGFEGAGGRHLLRVGMARWERRGELEDEARAFAAPAAYLGESARAWQERWGAAWIEFPDANLTALWLRSLFYVLASYGPDVRAPAAPMGWAQCGWGFGYPQDLSFVHPALLRLGHFDIAKAWCENYLLELPQMQSYARRLWGARGAMAPWHFPMSRDAPLPPPGGDWRELGESAIEWHQYQIHNAAYPARMAHHTAQFLKDPNWTRAVAWPLVVEAARFFASFLEREAEGKWSLAAIPSSGQDEYGAHNARNYFDALCGARYCLRAALELSEQLHIELPEADLWRRVLDEGLAFERLRDPKTGLLATSQDPNWTPGRQKHPVQLSPLAFLPLGAGGEAKALRADALNAYRQRHALCQGGRDGVFYGWTLPTYWLAGARAGDAAGLQSDLTLAATSGNTDANWIQLYESAPRSGPFFVTSHGLALQALCDAFVCDFEGETRLGAALPPSWQGARFGGLRTSDGKVHDGCFDESLEVTSR